MTVAIVLAGSSNAGPLKECSDALNEALIKIGDRCMVEYVVKALSDSASIERIIISGPRQALEQVFAGYPDVEVSDGGQTIVQSLLNGLELVGLTRKHVLIVTSDIPLITGEIVDDFLKKCYQEEADVIYPIVEKSLNELKYPGVKRTYVRLKEGIFTGGNIFYVNPAIIKPCAKQAENLISLRKSPLKLANYIGVFFILKYLLKRLSIKEAEERVSKLFNIRGKAITFLYPEIGIDVDKPSDLSMVTKRLTHI